MHDVSVNTPLVGAAPRPFRPHMLFWNIVKSFAGAGTFGLPGAIANAGLWLGIVGIIGMSLFTNYTFRTLAMCSNRIQERRKKYENEYVEPPTYSEIGYAAFGLAGSTVASLFNALMCFGVCIVYYNLIGANMSPVIHLESAIIIWIAFPITVFFSCLTDLSKLAYTSIGGSVALIVSMCCVIGYGFSDVGLLPLDKLDAYKIDTFPSFLGTAAFLFCAHVIIIPLANNSGNFRKFPRVLDYAMIFVTVINVIFAALAYGFFGPHVCGNVIGNILPDTLLVAKIVRIGISLEVLASFPLVANAGFQAIEDIPFLRPLKPFPALQKGDRHPLFSSNVLYYLFRGGIIALLALLAATVKNFEALISLVGSLTIMSTGFVFPQLFYLKLYHGEVRPYDYVIQGLIIVFGIVMTILGTIQSVDGILHSSNAC